MSGSLSAGVLSALSAGAQGKYVPPPATPSSPSQATPGPDLVPVTNASGQWIGYQRPPGWNAPQQTTDPASNVLGALSAGSKGQYRAPPEPQPPSTPGLLPSIAAGANRTIAGALGFLPDVAAGALNLVPRAINSVAGTQIPLIQNPVGGSEWLKEHMPLLGAPNPDTIHPQTEGERMAAAVGSGLASLPLMALGGAGIAGAAPEGSLLAGAGAHLAQMPIVPALAPVATGAATGQLLQDAVPEPLKPTANMLGNIAGAGGMAALEEAPGAIARGFRGLGNAIGTMGFGRKIPIEGVPEPVTNAQLTSAAGRLQKVLGPETLQQTAQLVNERAPEIIPGAPRTVAQITADRPEGTPIPAVAGLEVSARNRMPAPFVDIQNQQRNAMARGIEGMQEPSADPQALAQFFINELDRREGLLGAAAGSAKTTAKGAARRLGEAREPEEIGEAARGAVQARLEPFQNERRDLWNAMQQDKNLTLGIMAAKRVARQLLAEYNPQTEAPLDADEKRIMQQLMALPYYARYGDVVALRRQITDAIRAGRAGKALTDTSMRRLTLLKQGIDDSIREAVAQAAGTSSEFAAELAQDARVVAGRGNGEHQAQAETGRVPPGGSGPGTLRPTEPAGTGASAQELGPVAGVAAEGNGGNRPSELSGEPGRSGEEGAPRVPRGVSSAKAVRPRLGTFTPEAAGRYQQARAKTAEEHRLFGQGPVGKIMAKGARGEVFALPEARIMSTVLSGPDAPEKFARFAEAVGERQAQQLAREAIIRDLTDSGIISPDGVLDAKAFQRWLNGARGRVIREIPGLGEQLHDAARAQQIFDQTERTHVAAVKEYRNGVAKRFLDGTDPGLAIRTALNGQQPAREMTRILNAIGNNADALASLRDHVAHYLADRFTTVSEVGENAQAGLLKAETFRNFIRDNKDWLRRLYPGNGGQSIHTLEQIAAEIRRMRLVATAAEGSPTASYLQAARRHGMSAEHGKGGGTLFGALGAVLGEHAAEAVGGHGLTGMVVGGVAVPRIHALYQAGIETQKDLIAFAMAHPAVFKVLAERAPSGEMGPVASRRIGAAIRSAILSDEMRKATGSERE